MNRTLFKKLGYAVKKMIVINCENYPNCLKSETKTHAFRYLLLPRHTTKRQYVVHLVTDAVLFSLNYFEKPKVV